MSCVRCGRSTVKFTAPPAVVGFGSAVGRREGDGPLGSGFDAVFTDATLGRPSWEAAETALQTEAFSRALARAGLNAGDLDRIFAGDLLNQCVASSLAHRGSAVPYLGLYGACSTMAEALGLAALCVDSGGVRAAAAVTSSHFCSAERQYRMPLEYGGQRPPTAQWTATASGCAILAAAGSGPRATHFTAGRIVDAGIADANNMGAAMAPAACATLAALFAESGLSPTDPDRIFTGDLGSFGLSLLRELLAREGLNLSDRLFDCGEMLYAPESDAHCGGSGAGCSAGVLCGHILPRLLSGEWRRVVFAGTGALHSPTTLNQGESIPGICHAVVLCADKEAFL